MSNIDPYKILKLAATAADREIKEAYRSLARVHHPDVGGDAEEFKNIQEAYALIGDPVKRAVYDLERRRSGVNDARKEAIDLHRPTIRSRRIVGSADG